MAKNAPIAPPIRRRAIATVAIKSIGFLLNFEGSRVVFLVD